MYFLDACGGDPDASERLELQQRLANRGDQRTEAEKQQRGFVNGSLGDAVDRARFDGVSQSDGCSLRMLQ